VFTDLFCRIPAQRLAGEADWLLQHGLCPEVAIASDFIATASAADIATLTDCLRRFHACTVHAPFIDMFPGSADADVRAVALAKLGRTMEWAEAWQARLVVMHFNYDPIYYRNDIPRWLGRIAESFHTLLERAATPLIALENIAEPTPEIAVGVAAAIAAARIVPCFDVGHHHVFARTPVTEWLQALKPKRHVHFHFHDNDGSDDHHLPLGAGTIDWAQVKAAMAALAVPFSVALEPHTAENRALSLAAYRRIFLDAAPG
jgi:sugar phosphate isomerase/epimerase